MLLPANLAGILMALTSAAVWGSGDFIGGFASRRTSQFSVLALSALSGIGILALCALIWREALPSLGGATWAVLGGAAGALGMAALYKALSMGHAASVAPTSGVIGAGLPVIFSILTQGLPGAARLEGFLLAFIGIWLVSQSAAGEGGSSRRSFILACLSGVGFGGFFILIAKVDAGKIFSPLIVARSATFGIALILLWANRLPLPGLKTNPIALLAGVLDAGGNVFYLLARQFTSFEVAAVLSSLYPASTVLLSSLLMKERISRSQWIGVVVCLAAIALITV
jgi:drug/metabolite transporter (DMT)-like permease